MSSIQELDKPFFFLFDNNVFDNLCKSKESINITNYLDSIYTQPILRQIKKYSLMYTPFSILEALSINIPYPQNIMIEKNILKTKDAENIATLIFQSSLNYYKEEKCLSLENINKKLEQEYKQVNDKSHWLFDNTVFNIIKNEQFLIETLKALSMDYTIKYDYPREIRAIMNGFFALQFFIDAPVSNSISKFRLAKKLWDYYYQKEKYKKSINDIRIPNKAMSLKRNKDYLDGDLIHYLCFGMKSEGETYRTVIFTSDSKDNLIFRISVYKWIIDFIEYSAMKENHRENIYEINTNNGLLVICSNNFLGMEVIDVSSIKPLYKVIR